MSHTTEQLTVAISNARSQQIVGLIMERGSFRDSAMVLPGSVVYSEQQESNICRHAFNVTDESTARNVPIDSPVTLKWKDANKAAGEATANQFGSQWHYENTRKLKSTTDAIVAVIGEENTTVEARYIGGGGTSRFGGSVSVPNPSDPQTYGLVPTTAVVFDIGNLTPTADQLISSFNSYNSNGRF